LVFCRADLVGLVEEVGLLKIGGDVNQGSYLRDFWQEVCGKIHDLFKQEPALAVEL